MTIWGVVLVLNIVAGVAMAWDGGFFRAAEEASRQAGMSRGMGLVFALALYPIVVLVVLPALLGYVATRVVQLALLARRLPPELRRGVWRRLKAEYAAAVNQGRFAKARRAKQVAP